MAKERKNTLLTAPNALSILRILLVPVFLLTMIHHKAFHSLVVFLIAGSTDLFDGMAARIWHQKTRIGAILDPAADKVLLTAAFIALSIPSLSSPNVIPLWLTTTVIGRDVMIAGGSLILMKITDQKVFYPTALGKASTVCQLGIVFLILLLNFVGEAPSYLSGIYFLTLFVTVLSGIQYVTIGIRTLK